ncbi:uncharacterized protein LOC144716314 isoform X2 [Wolffia australiana]
MTTWKLVAWTKKRVLDPLVLIIRRGAEPKLLAFSFALGFTLGLFPICGVTVFLCGMGIALLRNSCHAPTVMLANFVATPFELSMVIPFLRFGEFISGGPHLSLNKDALMRILTFHASTEILLSVFHALLGWLAASPLILASLYLASLPCFQLLTRKLVPKCQFMVVYCS